MSKAFVFPGQGSQTVGMAKELAETFPSARALLDEVDEALGQKLSALMFEGPIETLTLTENAQPALMAASLAVMRVLEKEKGFSLKDRVAFVAGLMLGGLALWMAAPSAIGAPIATSAGQLVVAGALVGAGTQLANGCTSGHGVCGLSRGSLRSLVATLAFMVAGAVVVAVAGGRVGGP